MKIIPSIEVIHPSGALRLTDVVGGEYFKQIYFGYSRREAVSLFKQYVRKEMKTR